MAELPELDSTVSRIYAAHERRVAAEKERHYLGGSILGDKCDRYLWLYFRVAYRKPIDGRMARLFETGHLEEDRHLRELRDLGIVLYTHQPDGSQIPVEYCDGHGRGNLDAIGKGFVEAPETWHLVDVKTVKGEKMRALRRLLKEHQPGEALKIFEPRYYGQAQTYMGLQKLTRAIYSFVCKDTDEIQFVRFKFDREYFDGLMARARKIVYMEEPPPPISFDATWYECVLCDMHPVCHGTQMPRAHCRTCAHSTPHPGPRWRCEMYDADVPAEHQVADGKCCSHRFIPILLDRAGQVADVRQESDGNSAVTYQSRLKEGAYFTNGREGFASREIAAARDPAVLDDGDAALAAFRKELGAEIVG